MNQVPLTGKKRILVVDDEKSIRDVLEILLVKEGYDVETARNGQEARRVMEKGECDVVITDMKMPVMGGMDLLRCMKEAWPQVPVIVITAYSSVEGAVETMKLGAYDYMIKPFKVDEIKLVIRNALEKRELQGEYIRLGHEVEARQKFGNIIGDSSAMMRIFDMIGRVAFSKSTVLITGESGTGKELVARAIHHTGPRRNAPFLSINCGAMPESLLESELFGHQKGAFTGAVSDKKGLLEMADGGTFFLDEVSDMSPSLQVKLLRVLQEREFIRVGGTQEISVDVRIIAASNVDLQQAVAERRFREDLYYRLNVIPIHVPPLSERREDIPLLVYHFIARHNAENEKKMEGITPEALASLERYHWPGNVRELENVIERACTLERGNIITPESLPSNLFALRPLPQPAPVDIPDGGLDLERELERIEKDYLMEALNRAGGVKKRAAELLNLSFRSMRYRLKKLDIDDSKE